MVRENTDIPCAIGFGISTPEQAEDGDLSMEQLLVQLLQRLCQIWERCTEIVGEYAKSMKDAILL